MATGQNHQLRMNASQTQDMQQDQIAINERQQRLNLNQSHNHGWQIGWYMNFRISY